MPTVSTSPNMTIMLTVMPTAPRIRKPIMNEVGMAIPTSSAERRPSAASTTIITSRMAVMIADCSDPSTSNMKLD